MARTYDEKPAAAVAFHGEIWTDGRGLAVVVLPTEARSLRPPLDYTLEPTEPLVAATVQTPADPMPDRARRLLRDTPIIDGHNDYPWTVREKAGSDLAKLDLRQPQPAIMTDFARLAAGGVGGQFWSVYVPAPPAGSDPAVSVTQTIDQIDIGEFELIGAETDEQLPLVAFQLAGEHNFDEFDVASHLAAERGWMVPAYTLPPKADHVTIMRALVKLTLGHSLAATLADDSAEACETLKQKGGLHPRDRKRVKTNTSF